METSLRSLSKKSETAGAIRYALAHWRALTRFLDDSLLEIDNNSAERALRCVALGRRNYLFAGADSGGDRAAAIYSLVGSAKLNGLDPERYLRSILSRIAEHPISPSLNCCLGISLQVSPIPTRPRDPYEHEVSTTNKWTLHVSVVRPKAILLVRINIGTTCLLTISWSMFSEKRSPRRKILRNEIRS
jgi:hypothetical protein